MLRSGHAPAATTMIIASATAFAGATHRGHDGRMGVKRCREATAAGRARKSIMRSALLDRMRCPFCGTRLDLLDNAALSRTETRIEAGVLGCECCAFPVVAGIPVLLADDRTREAMHALERGGRDEALATVLGLTRAQAAELAGAHEAGALTYREAVAVLAPDAEGVYFLHRFSDPTFVAAEAVLRTLDRAALQTGGPLLDLCGGSGHLAHALAGAGGNAARAGTVVADLYFRKLWLATRVTAPHADGVCCSADAPLPFTPDSFAMVVLMDAFPYIWHKRLCADEMMRVARPDGILALPHLHSSEGENASAGDPLSPTAYRGLFTPFGPVLFSEARLLNGLIEAASVDLADDRSPAQLRGEPALTLVASRRTEIRRRAPAPEPAAVAGVLAVNPLYAVEVRDGRSVLTLRFPTPEYEEEFGYCRRYLPDRITVAGDLSGPLEPRRLGPRYAELRRRRVILDLPPRYL